MRDPAARMTPEEWAAVEARPDYIEMRALAYDDNRFPGEAPGDALVRRLMAHTALYLIATEDPGASTAVEAARGRGLPPS